MDIVQNYGFCGKKILDVGCGTGSAMLPLLKKGYDVEGVDFSSKMIDIAKEKLKDYSPNLYVDDITKFTLKKKFDLIISVDDVMNHLTSKTALLSCFDNIRNLLNESGMFIFDVNTIHTFRTTLNKKTFFSIEDDMIIFDSKFNSEEYISHLKITTFSKKELLYEKLTQELYERYFSYSEIFDISVQSNLKIVGVLGLRDRNIQYMPNDETDVKLIYVLKAI